MIPVFLRTSHANSFDEIFFCFGLGYLGGKNIFLGIGRYRAKELTNLLFHQHYTGVVPVLVTGMQNPFGIVVIRPNVLRRNEFLD